MHLTHIYIYPVKSLGGISLQQAAIDSHGLADDRRWMIVDDNNTFLTQRHIAAMSQIAVNLHLDHIELVDKRDQSSVNFYKDAQGDSLKVYVWEAECTAFHVDDSVDEWLSEKLQSTCRLVKMAPDARRLVDPNFSRGDQLFTAFTDGFPFLIIGKSSLDLLNSKLENPVDMQRFRPNFVFSGGEAHVEDQFGRFTIGDSSFEAVKPCSRCVVTTINPSNGIKGKEPLKTLAEYRRKDDKIMFGQNLICHHAAIVKIGDNIVEY